MPQMGNRDKWENYKAESYILRILETSTSKEELLECLWVFQPERLTKLLSRQSLIRISSILGFSVYNYTTIEIARLLEKAALR